MFKLRVYSYAQERVYPVYFATERAAMDFCLPRMTTHAFDEYGEDDQIPDGWDELWTLLNPKCPHGLSARLCAGPQHYDYDDDELRALGAFA